MAGSWLAQQGNGSGNNGSGGNGSGGNVTGDGPTIDPPASVNDSIDVLSGFSFVEQLLLTLVIVVAIVAVRYFSKRWHSTHDREGWQHLTVSGTVAVVTAVAIFLLVDLWDQVGELGRAIQNFGGQEMAGTVLIAVVILGATYAITSFVGRAIQITATRAGGVSEHQREVVYRLSQIILYTLGILITISLFTNLGSVLVGAGFLGIIVGMAARQTLGAVLAGFVLMFSRPFEIGDWVEFDETEGVVTDIGIVNTRVQTFDGELVTLPNDQVSANTIINRTRKGRYRIEVEVGADYDDEPERAVQTALEAVSDLDEVLDVPSPQVVTKRFGDSAVVFGVRCWIDNPSKRRMWRARSAMIDAIYTAFSDAGVKIPFPQRELMARNEEGGFRLTRETAAREAPAGDEPTREESGDDEASTSDEGSADEESSSGEASTATTDGGDAVATGEVEEPNVERTADAADAEGGVEPKGVDRNAGGDDTDDEEGRE
ncbi:mechanosensitive ion channel domain-containing protein [Halobium salinum]|uniref:Mechanosensitive ion channel domain-containing protein n=1 Tax=Halobium salinum TaxID=1364940 RepID=A0ABD5P8H7_9EURY|nr:mechanosensitive ion channel domain-containing protein [Halobium salinum]